MATTINTILKKVTENYLATQTRFAPPPPDKTEQDLLNDIKRAIQLENGIRSQAHEPKLKIPEKLTANQVAEILNYFYHICLIVTAGEESDRDFAMLALYQVDGPNEGLYVIDETIIRSLIRKYNYTISKNEASECINVLREIVDRRELCKMQNLVAVNNGIFDYETKQLLPFNPGYIFMAKSRVDYVQNPINPVIHCIDDGTDWDVETWMQELSDDQEVVNLLWEILGAIVRPLVPWNKSAWFYSQDGNNGKGTLCELMRNLCGPGAHASVPLADMGKDFALEPLIRASAVIVDENDVGTYIDKAANLKAIITGDVISVNRKFKAVMAFRFRGFMVQCINEYPKVKDKSDSFFRRQLFVPFTKCFTGVERKYIKDEYLKRKEVLEYVLWRVLNMNYYSLSEPQSCKLALAEYKEHNDPVRQFAEDILSQAAWTLLPKSLLYQAYKTWFKENMPSGTVQGRNNFYIEFRKVLKNYPEWKWVDKEGDKDNKVPAQGRMDVYEPLLSQYELTDWMNPKYVDKFTSSDEDRCTPMLGQYMGKSYRGAVRCDLQS